MANYVENKTTGILGGAGFDGSVSSRRAVFEFDADTDVDASDIFSSEYIDIPGNSIIRNIIVMTSNNLSGVTFNAQVREVQGTKFGSWETVNASALALTRTAVSALNGNNDHFVESNENDRQVRLDIVSAGSSQEYASGSKVIVLVEFINL